MPTHDVTLPSKQRPKFPPRCVCCEREQAASTITLTVTGADEGPGFGEAALDAVLGSTSSRRGNRRFTVTVPACPKCGIALRRRHFWKTAFLYLGVLFGLILLLVALALWNSLAIGLVALFAGILAPVVWELIDPPGFTFTPAGGQITYEFRSQLCAQEFAQHNAVVED
jgi:hypothetical protein